MRTRLAGSTFGLLVGVSAAVAAGSIAAPAAAQDKPFELKLSHWVPPSHPLQKALEDWGELGPDGHRTAPIDVHRVPGPAAGQGLRPLRHGARRHRRRHLHQPRLSAGPLPHHRRGRAAVPDVERQGRLAGARRLVPQVRRHRDEGRASSASRFVHDSGSFHSKTKKIMVPGDIKGMKIRPAHATMAHARHHARRHQRAVVARPRCATSWRRAWPTP